MTNGIGSLNKQRLLALLPGVFALALLSTETAALSLGEINVQSSLNQPFNAAIPVKLSAGESLSDMHISSKLLADPGGNTEISGPALHLTLERRSNSSFIVHVSSDETIQATNVRLTVTFSNELGQTSREYSVLIDPVRSLSDLNSTATTAATESSRPATRLGPVAASETLWSIAGEINSYPDISQAQMALALFRANPQAFYQPTINALKSGEYLSIPAHDDIARIPPEQAKREIKAGLEQYREARNRTQSGLEEPAHQSAAASTAEVLPAPADNNIQSEAATPEPAPEALPPAPVVEANNQGQSLQIVETTPAQPIEAPSALTSPPQSSVPADTTTKPGTTWIISVTSFAVLLAVAIRQYLEQRRRRIAEEDERRARQAEVSRTLLKEKMLADIQYPQRPTGKAPVHTAETPPTETRLPETTQPQQAEAPAAPALSAGLSLLPLGDETPTEIHPGAPTPPLAAYPPVTEKNNHDVQTATPSENISTVISDLTDMDENETKLDLALTYTAMGDRKCAANLLADVIANGSDAQQAEASRQLEKLNQGG
jgi:pilus assembly protein FimV